MGYRVTGRSSRQHPNLTDADSGADRSGRSALRVVIFALLAVDGMISAILGALFLQIRVGGVALPVSALGSGLLNTALVWVGLQWTDSLRLAAMSVWTWLVTVLVLTLGGPGGDQVFGGRDLNQLSPLVLLLLGLGPPVALLRRMRA